MGPGFDVLGLALDIYNTVEMAVLPDEGLVIEATGEGAKLLHRTGSRLLVDAAMRVFSASGIDPPGLFIRQHTRIPVFSGLGSSAAAIVGGMVAANSLLAEPLPPDKLLDLAAEMEGHPDNVAPALFGGLVAACRTDDGVKHVRIQPPASLLVVVVAPDFQLPTKRSRDALPATVSFEDAVFNLGRTALLIAAMFSGDANQLSWAMEDRLHQPYRSKLVPGLEDVIAAAKDAGALATVLSGAGPAVISFMTGNRKAVGQAMKEGFLRHGVTSRIMEAAVSGRGALSSVKNY
jgi:homoserine kinase